MIAILLDVSTIIFIVGGLMLLWLNLRVWRPRTGSETLPEQTTTPEVDIAGSRAQAEECLKQAEQALSQTDRETWLQMAAQWIKLAEDAEHRTLEVEPHVKIAPPGSEDARDA
jgi:hypothetical protein